MPCQVCDRRAVTLGFNHVHTCKVQGPPHSEFPTLNFSLCIGSVMMISFGMPLVDRRLIAKTMGRVPAVIIQSYNHCVFAIQDLSVFEYGGPMR